MEQQPAYPPPRILFFSQRPTAACLPQAGGQTPNPDYRRQADKLPSFAASLLCELFFFLLYSRKDAEPQRNCFSLWTSCQPEAFASSLLCAPNTFFFFSQRPTEAGRTQSPVRRGGQAQRNCGSPLCFCF